MNKSQPAPTVAHTPICDDRYATETIVARLESAIDWLVATPLHTDQWERGTELEEVRPSIVRAVNSHAALVEACGAAEVVLSAVECKGDKPLSTGQVLDQLRAALALAKGGQSD